MIDAANSHGLRLAQEVLGGKSQDRFSEANPYS